MKASFANAYGSVTFTVNPLRPPGEQSLEQASKTSAGGERAVYSAVYSEKEVSLQWERMPLADQQALETFFISYAVGMVRSFTYTDCTGATDTLYFAEPVLEFEELPNNVYRVNVKLERLL